MFLMIIMKVRGRAEEITTFNTVLVMFICSAGLQIMQNITGYAVT